MSCSKEVKETQPVVQKVIETVFASGSLKAQSVYNVTSRTEGYLSGIYIRENEHVALGVLLAKVDNPQNLLTAERDQARYDFMKRNLLPDAPSVLQAENTIKESEEQLAHDTKQLERYKQLFEANTIPKVEYERILLKQKQAQITLDKAKQSYAQILRETEEQVLNQYTQSKLTGTYETYNKINALQAGTVLKCYKELGDYVRPGEVIATIGDISELYAQVNVDEKSIRKIRVGQKTLIQLNVDQEKKYKGEVVKVLPSFDQSSQSFIVHIRFLDTLDFNYVDTQLQVNIEVDSTLNALLIPRAFLSYDSKVSIKGEENAKKIKTKLISNDWVQVLNGIDSSTVLTTKHIQ
jgi:multidrug resistance efflux pump